MQGGWRGGQSEGESRIDYFAYFSLNPVALDPGWEGVGWGPMVAKSN